MADASQPPRQDQVESNDYSVELIHGFRELVTIRYAEADRVVLLDGELVGDWRSVAVWRADLRTWQPPHAVPELPEPQREVILDRMRTALGWQGMRLEVIDDRVSFLPSNPEAVKRRRSSRDMRRR